jgi:hypothetical protein
MNIKYVFKYFIAVLIIVLSVEGKSYASGFPTRPGRLIVSPSVSYFFANKEWDSTGVKKPFANNGKFTSISFNLYAEYGISRRFSAVFLLPYIMNTYAQSGYPKSSVSGLTDMETGIKYYLANINYVDYFSLQATAITPLYNNPNLGYNEEGAELKLSFAGSGAIGDKNFFFNFDEGGRYYFGPGGPFQDRYAGTFGLTLDNKFENQLSLTASGIYTTSNNHQNFNLLNPYVNKNFSFTQVSLSYGHTFSKRFTVFLTGGQFVIGRNTGAGTSGTVALIYRIGN